MSAGCLRCNETNLVSTREGCDPCDPHPSGVTIAMGTDIGVTGPDRPNSWGGNGSELGYLVKLGMTPLQAIEAATATAPMTLGPQAPKSGKLETGYDADVITVGADPLADISVLARPEHITAAWTVGRRVNDSRSQEPTAR